jgi:hypothetical protein
MSVRWSKWWWLQIYSIPTWSADERRAAGVFGATFLAAFLFMGSFLAFYISVLKFELYVTLTASIAISLWVAIANVRGMASEVFPGTIRKGDEAAAKRLGGTVVLPDESPGLWWINYGAGTNKISPEEKFTRIAIFFIAMPIFFPAALFFPPHLMVWLDVSKRTAILATMVTMLPLSFFIGRKLTACMWPDVVRRADENAFARYNYRKHKPQE